MQVQNKLQLAMPLLPQEVQQQGVQVTKSARNFLIVVGLISEDGSMTNTDLADYVSNVLQDPISRHRAWATSRSSARSTPCASGWIRTSSQIPAHHLRRRRGDPGAERAGLGGLARRAAGDAGPALNATIIAQSRLQTPEQFGTILLRVNPDGSRVFLRDVARVELGSENYTTSSHVQRQAGERHGHPARARARTRSKPWPR